MGFCLLQWVFLAAVRMSFSGLNISVRLRETRMVYPNPQYWESKTSQLTQPRALGPAFKMQTSFAPFLCCQDSTDQLSMKAFGRLKAGHQCEDFIPRVLPEQWWEDGHLSAPIFPGRMTQQQQTSIKPGSTLFPGPGTITPRQLC